MKIYIVTSGEYSDYGINAVFLEKEKAEKYCEVQNGLNKNINYPCYYNEWETEDDEINMNTKVVKYYFCEINLKTGQIDEPQVDIETEQTDNRIYTRDTFYDICDFDFGAFVTAYSINSYEQAKKIAIEQYQLYTQRKLEDEL